MGNFDEVKGRAKKTVGEATDNDDLKEEGSIDKVAGQMKSTFNDIVDKVAGRINEFYKRTSM